MRDPGGEPRGAVALAALAVGHARALAPLHTRIGIAEEPDRQAVAVERLGDVAVGLEHGREDIPGSRPVAGLERALAVHDRDRSPLVHDVMMASATPHAYRPDARVGSGTADEASS